MAADPGTGHAAAHSPLDNPFHHVLDASSFEIPFLGDVPLPAIPFLPSVNALIDGRGWVPLQLTKFMVLQLMAAGLAFAIFVPLAGKIRNGALPRGRVWGFWEMICLFLRDEVVRPTIGDPHVHAAAHGGPDHHDLGQHGKGQHDPGHADPLKQHNDPVNHPVHTALPAHELAGHPADQYLPVIWSLFFYVLFCNLLGAIPGLGSPTGDVSVTAVLALFVFAFVLYVGMKASGVAGFWGGLVPQMDVPRFMKPFLVLLMWPIEFFGLLVKHFVLAVRLFANMMAGHTVLFVILGFIWLAADAWLKPGVNPALGYGMYGAITAASIAGQVFISLLELFVAFLQAYVFAFLATLFISAAVHPH